MSNREDMRKSRRVATKMLNTAKAYFLLTTDGDKIVAVSDGPEDIKNLNVGFVSMIAKDVIRAKRHFEDNLLKIDAQDKEGEKVLQFKAARSEELAAVTE